MPLDPTPHQDGTVLVTRTDQGEPLAVIATQLKGTGQAHQSHFATCPNVEPERPMDRKEGKK